MIYIVYINIYLSYANAMLLSFKQSGGLFGTQKSQPKQEKPVPAPTANKPVPASKGEIT